jgi:hypothetical protein
VSEGEEATGRTDRAAGRVRPVGWPDRWAWPNKWARVGRERGERRVFLTKNLKTEIDKRKRAFLEKRLFNTN